MKIFTIELVTMLLNFIQYLYGNFEWNLNSFFTIVILKAYDDLGFYYDTEKIIKEIILLFKNNKYYFKLVMNYLKFIKI